MLDKLLQYGILGIIVAALAAFVLKLMHDHKKEREEWKKTIEEVVDKFDKREEESNKVLREHTNILAALRSLLEKRK